MISKQRKKYHYSGVQLFCTWFDISLKIAGQGESQGQFAWSLHHSFSNSDWKEGGSGGTCRKYGNRGKTEGNFELRTWLFDKKDIEDYDCTL